MPPVNSLPFMVFNNSLPSETYVCPKGNDGLGTMPISLEDTSIESHHGIPIYGSQNLWWRDPRKHVSEQEHFPIGGKIEVIKVSQILSKTRR